MKLTTILKEERYITNLDLLPPTAVQVLNIICTTFNIKPITIKSSGKSTKVTTPEGVAYLRSLYYYLAMKFSHESSTIIAETINRSTRSAALYGHGRIIKMKKSKKVQNDIADLTEMIKKNSFC